MSRSVLRGFLEIQMSCVHVNSMFKDGYMLSYIGDMYQNTTLEYVYTVISSLVIIISLS